MGCYVATGVFMYIEYRTQVHQMDIDGTSDDEPFACDIVDIVESNGFTLENLDIWFDQLQGFWRFNGDIKELDI